VEAPGFRLAVANCDVQTVVLRKNALTFLEEHGGVEIGIIATENRVDG
jgi:hypothetical protein